MPLTIEALEAQLDAIQAAKASVLAAMATEQENEQTKKWRVGEVSFDESASTAQNLSDKLATLIKAEKDVIELMRTSFPTEHVVTHLDGVDGFGRDVSNYQNEAD
jgi:DICT domain-containing protein